MLSLFSGFPLRLEVVALPIQIAGAIHLAQMLAGASCRTSFLQWRLGLPVASAAAAASFATAATGRADA